jgi:hypothetical protein
MPENASDDELLTVHDAASFERFYCARSSSAAGRRRRRPLLARTSSDARRLGARLLERPTVGGVPPTVALVQLVRAGVAGVQPVAGL